MRIRISLKAEKYPALIPINHRPLASFIYETVSLVSPKLYGLLCKSINKVWLRFVEVRPVSCITISYLQWVVRQLEIEKKKVLLLIWDNATWHKSKQVRSWIKEHNKEVKSKGGIRILKCFLPIKSPWLNPIEPRWVHPKRSIVKPTNILSSNDLISRVSSYFNNPMLDLLKQDLL